MAVGSWLRRQVSTIADKAMGDDFASRSKALTVRQNEYGFDPFGFHRDSLRLVVPLARWLHRSYFRTEVHGMENLPPSGRLLLVSNHSGQLPFDGVVIGTALLLDANPPRMVRSMIERFVPTVPFVSFLLTRWGQITGTPENCRRLLEDEEVILVFPEGARGISKPFSKRYQLARFGDGFMRLALETKSPILPVAVIGAEEQAPAVNIKPLARLLRAPSFPVVPYPPFFPILPLPVKYRLYFGEPMHFSGDPDEEAEIVEDKVRSVRNRIQSMLHLGLRARKNVFW